MPPRSKQSQRHAEWTHCQLCQCFISSRENELHAQFCSEEKSFNVAQFELKNFRHSFIFNRTLVVQLDAEKELKDGKDKTPQKDGDVKQPGLRKKDIYIYMNPVTMVACGLTFLHPAIIDKCCVLLAVPDARLPLTAISVSESSLKLILDKKPGEPVVLQAMIGTQLCASELHVLPVTQKVCLADGDFLSHCTLHLYGTFVKLGGHIRINYLGSLCDLQIAKIVVENGNVVGPEDAVDSSASCIATKLADLCLSPQTLEGNSDVTNEKSSSKFSQCTQQFFKITEDTTVTIFNPSSAVEQSTSAPTVTLDDVGGLESQKSFLARLISSTLDRTNSSLNSCLGVQIPRAVLLFGPSGSGKTILAKAMANSLRLHLVSVSGSSILSPYVGEAEKHLQQLFIEARRHAPSLMLFDEIDALCPRRRSTHNDVEQRITSCVCSQLDAVLAEDCAVFIVGVTRKRDDVSPALTVATRFGVEIEISVPNSMDRASILECCLHAIPHNLTSSDIVEAASRAHGFVGADLAAVCREAVHHGVKHRASEVVLTLDDLQHGFKVVQPSAMKELAIEKPNVRWTDIGGMNELKLRLEQTIVWPIQHPEVFVQLGCRPPRGHLLYGPPGCSKTMIAKALATESDLNFIAVKGPELLSKWVGESERAVRELFRKARAAAPAIIFFDEIDALAVERGRHGGGAGDVVDRVMAQLLTEIDGVVELKDISILAATNRPDLIDKALKRPGRLDREIYVGLPDDAARREIFQILFRKTPVSDDVQIEELVKRTHRYSGAEVSAVVHEAAICSLSEGISSGEISKQVHARHFTAALDAVKARITDSELKFYLDYASQRSQH